MNFIKLKSIDTTINGVAEPTAAPFFIYTKEVEHENNSSTHTGIEPTTVASLYLCLCATIYYYIYII